MVDGIDHVIDAVIDPKISGNYDNNHETLVNILAVSLIIWVTTAQGHLYKGKTNPNN